MEAVLEKPANRADLAVPLYVALLLLCFLASLLALRHRQATEKSALAHSTLIVSPRDPDTLAFIESLSGFRDFRVIRADQPGAGMKIVRLAGTPEVSMPMLVVPSPAGPVRYSGTETVYKALEPLVSAADRYVLGEKAIVVLACMSVFCAFFGAEVAKIASLLPVVGIVALMGLPGACLACGTSGGDGKSIVLAVAPLLGLTHVFCANLLFCNRWYGRLSVALAFGAVSGAVPLVQAVALVNDPKLCPSCLAYGFVALAYTFAIIANASGGRWEAVIRLPKTAFAAIFAIVALLGIRNGMLIAGRLPAPVDRVVESTEFVGHSVSEYLSGTSAPTSRIVLIAQAGCSHCEDAERALAARKVPFDVFAPASVPTPGTFLVRGPMSVPVVLVIDPSNKIIYQRNGWISPQGESLLVEELVKESKNGKEHI